LANPVLDSSDAASIIEYAIERTMKYIGMVFLFLAAVAKMTCAEAANDEADISGEWIVELEGSGITVNITDASPELRQYAPGTTPVEVQSKAGPVGSQPQSMPAPRSIETHTLNILPIGTVFEFARKESKVAGSIIRGDMEDPIFDGKIGGNKVTFTVREIVKNKTYSYYYLGVIADDRIKFEVTPVNGGNRFRFMAKRVGLNPVQ
jgi:hypothetical protein